MEIWLWEEYECMHGGRDSCNGCQGSARFMKVGSFGNVRLVDTSISTLVPTLNQSNIDVKAIDFRLRNEVEWRRSHL